MPLLTLTDISLAYGLHPLLAHTDFQIESGERVCLVGRNGTGKSSLFRVITGAVVPDDGERWCPEGVRIAHLEQEVPADSDDTIYESVARGLGEAGGWLSEYHHLAQQVGSSPERLPEMSALQARIEAQGAWALGHRVDTVLSHLNLPADRAIRDCSGGIRRQVMLARALVSEPDLLLLDEPTNHLDIAAIAWLEDYLLTYRGAVMFITHDRTFLRHLATRIVELDRGKLTSFPGDFNDYLRKKDEMLEIEARAAAKFDKKLAEEEVWIRQGVKARRTRNEGRVRALQALRTERARRQEVMGRATLSVDSGALSGKLVVDVRGVSFQYGEGANATSVSRAPRLDPISERWVVRDFSTHILRGDRIGIVGPNGSGKSTLLKLILGELEPTRGKVVLGTRLQIAYFDQHRRLLDPEKSVRDNLSEGTNYVNVRGRSRHVIGYLKDFLFPPERIDSPVKALSGGERNRLLLARLFTQPCNMMVLDEPTNDLDVDTLELLEELLSEYDGTLLLVSHDRTFLDNVVTSTLVFETANRPSLACGPRLGPIGEGDGRVSEYVGGYEDWLRQRTSAPVSEPKRSSLPPKPVETVLTKSEFAAGGKRKLSYKEQRELASLPAQIQALEAEQAALNDRVSDSGFYQQDKTAITETLSRAHELKTALETAYARWEELENAV
ncbi:MAG: ABC transporter ATP-binding protein [Candidatus Muproteobacteria bacterium RBG_16_62_13]|uniref:ATP-binding protein Uup n=1 Tax=Candidatus Muproteobacteria bacterium RBG_16_62_13 TaxID=1817756 RepID=A0A1F6T4C9_9PROT|nr:MAG: ABC transporter ATP-binding protein [Candidatus Muproteobacteria bacterium RBG_16_62_13]